MNTASFGYDVGGVEVTGTLINSEDNTTQALTAYETPADSGNYVMSFEGIDAGIYYFVFSVDTYTHYQNTYTWNGTNVYGLGENAEVTVDLTPIENQLDDIEEAIAELNSSGEVTIISPVAESGLITIVQGDDTQIVLSNEDFELPADTVLTLKSNVTGCISTYEATEVNEHDATFNLSAEDTAALLTGTHAYTYGLVSIGEGAIRTWAIGDVTVTAIVRETE